MYADIVHESGFAETLVATVDLPPPAGPWRPSDRDDAWTGDEKREGGNVSDLADGSTMIWDRTAAPIVADRDAPLRFVVTDPRGRPATLEPYMGMAGHAMLTRADGAVFVHLHPAGSVSLAALETFQQREPGDTIRGALAQRLTRMQMGKAEAGAVPSGQVAFPYAFPKPGLYRIWVQVKRDGRILTGVFDADVRPSR